MKYLRFTPLLVCLLLALALSGDRVIAIVAQAAHAAGQVFGTAVWLSGPLVFAICLAFLFREDAARFVFDAALVGVTLVDGAAVGLVFLPIVDGGRVLDRLPLVQFFGLTALLVVVMLVRIAPGRSGPGSSEDPELAK